MTKIYLGLFVGGLLPAISWALGTICQKLSNKSGLNLSAYLLCISAGVIVSGVGSHFIFRDSTFSVRGGVYASLQGLCFSTGLILFAIGLTKFNMPVSQLSPIAASTTIFTVIFALILLSEYKSVHTVRVLVGSILMAIGAIVVARS